MDQINEKNTSLFTTTLEDADGGAIQKSDITGFTVTLFDKDSGDILNSRDTVDLYANDWAGSSGMVATVHATSGACTITFSGTDNAIINTSGADEVHVLLIEITTAAATLKEEIEFMVMNLTKVT